MPLNRNASMPALATAVLVLLIAGCSSPAEDPTASPAAVGTSAPMAPPQKSLATDAPTPEAPPAVTAAEQPFERYTPMDDDPLPWVAQYYAATGAAVDDAAVAERLDPTYANAHDAFAKRDALAAFHARLAEAIIRAKANPYLVLPKFLAELPAYDLDHGRYNLRSVVGDHVVLDVARNAAQVRFVLPTAMADYAPPNEAEARATEKRLAEEAFARKVNAVVYGKVVGGTLDHGVPQLRVAPVRVVLTTFPMGGPERPVFTATAP